ncbi:hypothetical protein WJX73_004423 [Symbiochloris irregularis]|uniref:Uncharacterized protein n=1 Tax=Symbiochloris irregularis TaxID=706552 RepID=A0AAW1PJC3_9CHLO
MSKLTSDLLQVWLEQISETTIPRTSCGPEHILKGFSLATCKQQRRRQQAGERPSIWCHGIQSHADSAKPTRRVTSAAAGFTRCLESCREKQQRSPDSKHLPSVTQQGRNERAVTAFEPRGASLPSGGYLSIQSKQEQQLAPASVSQARFDISRLQPRGSPALRYLDEDSDAEEVNSPRFPKASSVLTNSDDEWLPEDEEVLDREKGGSGVARATRLPPLPFLPRPSLVPELSLLTDGSPMSRQLAKAGENWRVLSDARVPFLSDQTLRDLSNRIGYTFKNPLLVQSLAFVVMPEADELGIPLCGNEDLVPRGHQALVHALTPLLREHFAWTKASDTPATPGAIAECVALPPRLWKFSWQLGLPRMAIYKSPLTQEQIGKLFTALLSAAYLDGSQEAVDGIVYHILDWPNRKLSFKCEDLFDLKPDTWFAGEGAWVKPDYLSGAYLPDKYIYSKNGGPPQLNPDYPKFLKAMEARAQGGEQHPVIEDIPQYDFITTREQGAASADAQCHVSLPKGASAPLFKNDAERVDEATEH